MNIRFIYQSNDYDIIREKTSKLVCDFISTLLDIPNNIEIVFAIMDKSLYGNTILDPRFKNRININNTLTSKEIPYVLVHELIHLHQIKTGRLSVTSNGIYVWNKIQYNLNSDIDYTTLPWEKDVVAKQTHILNSTLEYLSTTIIEN
jgi:hypothetical protein